ncbi:amidoligase family protein [Oceaniglobus ichthyenteri]|uniref:amidoligase family protein n=1 Tax=Oceaniglobus ichthyenteri TaxID=2136177 RepID=UPI000D33D7DB|nr:amidoligase family protein [Oceaniglobus ichthyenteri]
MPLAFAPLPNPANCTGAPRRVGVEIEFSGLGEQAACNVLTRTLGGRAHQIDSVKWLVENSEIGELQVYLDVFLRDAKKSPIRDVVLEAGRGVVPVEVVSRPLDRDGLIALDRARAALCQAGALGSGAGALNGFGVHFNIEARGDSVGDIFPTLLAFALCEPWLRLHNRINVTRRLLPWTDAYPYGLLDGLVALWPDPDMTRLIDTYLAHAPSRNYGLDMLPLFAHIDRDRVMRKMGQAQAVRPTFHFRLPDSLIDDPDWSLSQGWDQWRLIERIADTPGLNDALCVAWRGNRAESALTRPAWAEVAGGILADHGVRI